MAKQRGLGRGFDSLIPTDLPAASPTAALAPAVAAPATGGVRQVAVGAIQPNPHQPRSRFDETELASLADSIKQHGILHPPVVSDSGNGQYELIAGERRVRAAKLAGLTEVPVIVRSFSEQQKLELALLENVQRADLNPIETAAAYRKLMDEFNLTLDQVAQRMGKAKSTVANITRLLALPEAARQALASGSISEAHGRAILAVADPAAQAELLNHITSEGWTVRQAEAFARQAKAGAAAKPSNPAGPNAAVTPPASYLAAELGAYLGTKVSLQPKANGGRLVIEYYSDEELQRLVDTIKPAQ